MTFISEAAKNIFLQDERYWDYVDRYFEENPHHRVSWMHDIRARRYSKAMQSLLTESARESSVRRKHVSGRLKSFLSLIVLHTDHAEHRTS